MKLTTLSITNFKSYTSTVTISGFLDFNAIIGLNGSGKSNIFDALLFCLHLDNNKLLRVSSNVELINNNADEAVVTAIFSTNSSSMIVQRVLNKSGKGKTTINGQAVTVTTLQKVLANNNLSRNCLNVIMQGNIVKLVMLNKNCKNYIQDLANIKTYMQEKTNALSIIEKKEAKLVAAKEVLTRQIEPFFEKLRNERIFYLERKKAIENEKINLERKKEIEQTLSNSENALLLNELENEIKEFIRLKDEIDQIERKYNYVERETEDLQKIKINMDQINKDIFLLNSNIREFEEEKHDLQLKKEEIIITNEDIDALKDKINFLLQQEKIIQNEINQREKDEIGFDALTVVERTKKINEIKNNNMIIISEMKRIKARINEKAWMLMENDQERRFFDGSMFQNEVEFNDKYNNHKSDQVFKGIEELCNNTSTFNKENCKFIKEYLSQLKALYDKYNERSMERDNHRQSLDVAKRKLGYPIVEGIHGYAFENYTIKESKYYEAINVALGSRKRYIIVDNEKLGDFVIKNSCSHVNVIPLNKIRVFPQKKNALCAFDLIECPNELSPAFEFLLGNTYIFDSKEKAREYCFAERVICVSIDGNLYDPRGIVSGGLSYRKEETTYTRKEICKLEDVIEECDKCWKFCTANKKIYETIKEMINYIDSLVGKARSHESITENIILYEKLLKSKNVENELIIVQEEKRKITDKIRNQTQTEQKLKTYQERLTELEKKIENCKKQAIDCEKSFEKLSIKLVESVKKENEKKILEKENLLLDERKNEIILENTKRKNKIRKLIKKINEAKNRSTIKENGCIEDEMQNHGCPLNLHEEIVLQEFPELKNLHLAGINRKEYKLLSEHAIEELKVELFKIKSELNALQGKSKSVMDPKNYDLLEKNEESLKQLEEKIKKLDSDKQKIIKSINDLSEISSLEMEKAREHVNRVAKVYLNYFIPGSELVIDELYNLHIKIGTVKSSLGGLSGGQRSIIALCLVFSMLTYKPAPFYIFDEIDSALDLSYTHRIGELIKNEFKNAQFFVVSLKEDFYKHAECIFEVCHQDDKLTVRKMKG